MSAPSTLSPREIEVMNLIASGHTPSEITIRLNLSVKTMSTYRARIIEKTGVRGNAGIANFVIQSKLELAEDYALVAAALCAGVARWDRATESMGFMIVESTDFATDVDGVGVAMVDG